MKRLISTGSPMELEAGYSRAVVDDEWIFVSGTTGYDYATMTMPEDVATQTRNCFATIARTLEEAGSGLRDVVRVNYVITDRAHADIVFPIFGEYFGTVRPAAKLIVAGLLRDEMKIEIDVTARRQSSNDARS